MADMIRMLCIVSALLALLFAECAFCEEAVKTGEEANAGTESSIQPLSEDKYQISPQDVLSITVVAEQELTGFFAVSNDGTIKYPYIEYVLVAGKTVKQIEKDLTDRLKDGWLVNPQVIARVQEYSKKSVYVMGQVNRPGEHSFSGQNEMTLYRAVSMAGGFTRIAKMTKVVLMTADEKGNPKREEVDVSEIIKKPELDPLIRANDRIFVPERFF